MLTRETRRTSRKRYSNNYIVYDNIITVYMSYTIVSIHLHVRFGMPGEQDFGWTNKGIFEKGYNGQWIGEVVD